MSNSTEQAKEQLDLMCYAYAIAVELNDFDGYGLTTEGAVIIKACFHKGLSIQEAANTLLVEDKN